MESAEDTKTIQPLEAPQSRFNALKHGILRESVTPYEKLNYEAIYEELEAEFKPRDIFEKIMLERFVLSYIKVGRISKAEAELMLAELNPNVWMNDLEILPTSTLVKKGYEKGISDEAIKKLESYSRYETSAENRMYKAMSALLNLKNRPLVS